MTGAVGLVAEKITKEADADTDQSRNTEQAAFGFWLCEYSFQGVESMVSVLPANIHRWRSILFIPALGPLLFRGAGAGTLEC